VQQAAPCKGTGAPRASLDWDAVKRCRVTRLRGMEVRVAPSVGSKSLGNGFDHALRSHGWNNSRELVVGGSEQSTELS
jgi:hypothetical protein